MELNEYAKVAKQITAQGLIALGRLLEYSRVELRDEETGRSYSYRRLSALIKLRTNVSVGKDTLQRLEQGLIQKPSADTLLAIASAGYVLRPDGTPYSIEDLLKVASEEILLPTGSEENATQNENDG